MLCIFLLLSHNTSVISLIFDYFCLLLLLPNLKFILCVFLFVIVLCYALIIFMMFFMKQFVIDNYQIKLLELLLGVQFPCHNVGETKIFL